MIELEGGYLCEASRQAPTGEGAAIHQAPTDENGNLRGASHLEPTGEGAASRQAPTRHSEACHRGANSVVSHRRPQVWSAVVALTVRPAIAALTMFINIKLPSKTNIPFYHNKTRLAKLKMSVKKTTFLEKSKSKIKIEF